jgi:hypothetical protein
MDLAIFLMILYFLFHGAQDLDVAKRLKIPPFS